MGHFFFYSAPISFYFRFVGQLVFLPCHCIASAMISLNLCLLSLLWACHVYSFPQFTLPSISTRLVLISFWASSGHFIHLGILGSFHSFGHPRPVSFIRASLAPLILTFPWAFTKSLGLPWPDYHILYFCGLLAFELISLTNSFFWAPPVHLCLLFTSYDSHKLSISFFRAPLGPLAFFGAFLLFYRPVDHYSCHSGLMIFSYFANSSFFTLFILLDLFSSLSPFAKMSINKHECDSS